CSRRTYPRRSSRGSRSPLPCPSNRPPSSCRRFPCCQRDRAASPPLHSSRESLLQTSHAPLATSVLAASRTTSTSNSLARALRLPYFSPIHAWFLRPSKTIRASTLSLIAIVMPNPRHPVRQPFFIPALWRQVQKVIGPD